MYRPAITVLDCSIRDGGLMNDSRFPVELVKETLDSTPPELAADVMNRGIMLAGGGGLLRGLDQLISAETDIPVFIADDPLTCVVMGTARYLEELNGMLTSV